MGDGCTDFSYSDAMSNTSGGITSSSSGKCVQVGVQYCRYVCRLTYATKPLCGFDTASDILLFVQTVLEHQGLPLKREMALHKGMMPSERFNNQQMHERRLLVVKTYDHLYGSAFEDTATGFEQQLAGARDCRNSVLVGLHNRWYPCWRSS